MTNLVPLTVTDALAVAKELAASGMVPRDYAGKPGAIYAAIDLGASVGLRPMQAVQGIANINGRPALWGDAALGVVMAHPSFAGIDEDDAATALKQGYGRCKVSRKGCPDYEVRFTVDMAKAAGLWGKPGPWTQYAGRMLQMRARSWAFRDRFPDALKGIAVAEEARDIPADTVAAEVIDMMPREVGQTPPASTATPTPPAADDIPFEASSAQDGEVMVEIVKVEKSTGTNAKSGKPWTRYGVHCKHSDGGVDILGTFSDTDGGVADGLVGRHAYIVGKSREVGGKTYLDLVSVRPC